MNSPAVRFNLLTEFLLLRSAQLLLAAGREAALALCTASYFCVSSILLLVTGISMRLGAGFVLEQSKAVLSKSAGLISSSALQVSDSGRVEKENVLREVCSLDTRLLEFEKIARLQVPVIKSFYRDYYGITVSVPDAQVLAGFSDISAVSASLMRCCGISGKRRLSFEDLRRVKIIFPVFIRILSMHRRFVSDHAFGHEGLPETGNLYPLLVSIEELKAGRAELAFKWIRFRHDIRVTYEHAGLDFYLRMLSAAFSRVSVEGSFECRARYKRLLNRASKINLLKGVNYEQLD